MKSSIKVISIGHVDHGKSTLVGRLLYDAKKENVNWDKVDVSTGNFANFLDQLEEERINQMTIDVVHSQVEGKRYFIEFIDAPGHLEFIKNMMTGASDADAAQLIVSAAENEGIQDQTIRHLFLVHLFGINQLIVAVNKMDRVKYKQERFDELTKKVLEVMKEIGFEVSNIPFVPIAARSGENVFFRAKKIPWWRGKSYFEILEEALSPRLNLNGKPLRALVQDKYEILDKKLTIVKILSGSAKKGDKVNLALANKKTKLLSIQEFESEKDVAYAGDCVAFALEENIFEKAKRGEVLGSVSNPAVSANKIKAEIFSMFEGLNKREEISLRIGTNEVAAKIVEIKTTFDPAKKEPTLMKDSEKVPQDFAAEVIIETFEPIACEKFADLPPLGRLILSKDAHPLAAGVVVSNFQEDIYP